MQCHIKCHSFLCEQFRDTMLYNVLSETAEYLPRSAIFSPSGTCFCRLLYHLYNANLFDPKWHSSYCLSNTLSKRLCGMNSTAKFLRGPHTRSLTFRANQPSSLTRTLVLARKLSKLFFVWTPKGLSMPSAPSPKVKQPKQRSRGNQSVLQRSSMYRSSIVRAMPRARILQLRLSSWTASIL